MTDAGMTRIPLRLALAASVALLTACDVFSGFQPCPDDLLTRVDPGNRTLRVGQSYEVAATAWGCRGTKRLSDEFRYFAVDTTIARVDSVTGLVTARVAGTTDIGARGAHYGDALNRSHLTVTP